MKIKSKGNIWQVSFPQGSLNGMSLDDFRKAFGRRAFLPIDDMPDMAEGTGFVPFLDADGDMDSAELMFSDVILVDIRTDRRNVDRKVANVILSRREKKRGQPYSKKERKEALETVMAELMRKAVPVPSLATVIIVPKDDRIYFQASGLKKVESMTNFMLEAMGRDSSGVEMEPFGEAGPMTDAMTSLWHESSLGHGDISFEPQTVASDTGTTSSDDSDDLSFGCVNGKKCVAGKITLPNDVTICVKAGSSGIKYDLAIPKEDLSGMGDDADGIIAGMIHENYENAGKILAGAAGACDEAAVRRDFGKKAKFVVEQRG